MATRRAFTQQGELLKLSGDTFSIKEELKKLGARYDGGQKCWFVSNAEQTLKKLEFLGFLPAPATPELPRQPAADGQLAQPVEETEGAEQTWTVAQFTLFVDKIFRQHLSFDFWIVGELSSLKSSGGHVYFDLTEPVADDQRALNSGRAVSVSCCLWAGKVRLLADKLNDFPLADGVRVRLKVNCDFRREGSRLSLIVNDVDPQFTLGDLALKRQQIVRELKRRGLYDRQRMHSRWPELPLRIALITAAGSRAQTDFMNELALSHLAFSVTLFDCFMQGDHVRASVTESLAMIASGAQGSFDCIVITRGGGSRLDLRWFDDLDICKAIAYADCPVMTAIGHFEDVSIADEVASLAEKTPTAAARFLVNKVASGFERLLGGLERAARLAQHKIQRERQILDRIDLRLEQSAKTRLSRESDKLHTALRALKLVQNTAARPLRMGYTFLRAGKLSDSGQSDRHITADDFLTSAPPQSVEAQLWSAKHNAQVLVEMSVVSVRQLPLPVDVLESMVDTKQTPQSSSQEPHGR